MGDGSNNGFLSKVDMPTVIHATVIVVVVLVLYHFLFQR